VDVVDNPYAPGAGLRPPLLAGRQGEIDAFDAVLRRGELARASRGLVLTGLRGVGKTVLINELATRADARGWIVVQAETRREGAPALLTAVAAQLTAGIRRLHGPRPSDLARKALGSISAFTVTLDPAGNIGASVQASRSGSRGVDLEVEFSALAVDIGRAAMEAGVGAVLLVDELHELDRPSMAALAAGAHVAGQRSVPFVVVGAGLPNLAGRLAEAKSYAERLFDYRPLGQLDPDTAAQALSGPAAEMGVQWSAPALESVVEAAGGYPYFLQEFGSATWNVAAGRLVTQADARNGIRLGQATLDNGFFRSRWDRATATERLFLRAMSGDSGQDTKTSDVAARLGRTMSNLGPIRAGLIGKGLIYAPEYGFVAFTVPGMAGFIQREADR
jgi:hypothetical protein